MNEKTFYALESSVSPELDLFFVTAVALNASDNGTDDHIAYLGVKAFDDNEGIKGDYYEIKYMQN